MRCSLRCLLHHFLNPLSSCMCDICQEDKVLLKEILAQLEDCSKLDIETCALVNVIFG